MGEVALAGFGTALKFKSFPSNRPLILPKEVRQAANLGWRVYPLSPPTKLIGNSDLLIGEATCEIFLLEELAAEHSSCEWRIAVGPPSLCVLQIVGPEGGNSVAALSYDQGECLTLQAHRGDAVWAYFRLPKKVLVLRASARKLAPGVRILADGDSYVIAPFCNPWAEVEAIPYWLRDLAFETTDTPRGKATSVPASSHRPAPCRSTTQFPKPARARLTVTRLAATQPGADSAFPAAAN